MGKGPEDRLDVTGCHKRYRRTLIKHPKFSQLRARGKTHGGIVYIGYEL